MLDLVLPGALPAAMLAIVLLASIQHGVIASKKGVQFYGFGYRPDIQSAAERFWKLAVTLVVAAALIAWLAPHWESALGRPDWSHSPWQRWCAAAFLFAGLLIIVSARLTMGTSWRVGVPKEGPGALVTGGLFRFSRNPIFVGMFALTVGVFLWSPALVSAAALPLAAAMMVVQVRVEEEALTATHGDAYLRYVKSAPRWLWPIG